MVGPRGIVTFPDNLSGGFVTSVTIVREGTTQAMPGPDSTCKPYVVARRSRRSQDRYGTRSNEYRAPAR